MWSKLQSSQQVCLNMTKQASGPPEPNNIFVPYLPTWGPAGNTWRGYSRLRSGREHWAWMVVVEVLQGTLGGDGRGWGPAGNTGRGWSWLRSDREHCASRVAVEQEEEERRGGEEQATDIKSNNPHLAGGEQLMTTGTWPWIIWGDDIGFCSSEKPADVIYYNKA